MNVDIDDGGRPCRAMLSCRRQNYRPHDPLFSKMWDGLVTRPLLSIALSFIFTNARVQLLLPPLLPLYSIDISSLTDFVTNQSRDFITDPLRGSRGSTRTTYE